MLLDEPTTGLDTHAEELVVDALTRRVQGRIMIMTTHRPAVTALATRTVHLRRGGVLLSEMPEMTMPAAARVPAAHLATVGAL